MFVIPFSLHNRQKKKSLRKNIFSTKVLSPNTFENALYVHFLEMVGDFVLSHEPKLGKKLLDLHPSEIK